MDLIKFNENVGKNIKTNKKKINKLKKKNKKIITNKINELHEEIFEKIDCLNCANCCKTTGPLFTSSDISRISKKLKISENDFISEYLKIDEDDDYVLQQVPCRFLEEDNSCAIYDFRPKACREYPHTDSGKVFQQLNLMRKNAEICPAVQEIINKT